MSHSDPVTTLVRYFPKKGKEEEFVALLEKHWPTLDQLGLVTKMSPQVWRASDKETHELHFVELFQWRNEQASEVAHHTPEVMAVWEAMGTVLERLQLARLEPLRSSVASV